MKKYKKIIIIVICIIGITLIAVNTKYGKTINKGNSDKECENIEDVFKNIENDVSEAKSGKYPNLNVKSLNVDINSLEKLYQIDIIPNRSYKENTYEDNIVMIQSVINNFYGESVDMSGATVYVSGKREEDEMGEYKFEEFKALVEKGEINGNGYFLIFKDNREAGGKGFMQIDSSLVSTWLSKGEINSTSPMYGYETKKVYNLTLNENNLQDKVMLSDGEITIEEARAFIENYLNNELPYKKNDDFKYEVAEIRVLDVNGENALGFCVRKKYNNVPFDYIDGTTEGIYNSDFWDDRGELCMIKTTEVDNMCGLGGDTYYVEKSGSEIIKMCSLDEALRIVSKSIGENSVYDIYGAEIIYQFTFDNKETDKYKGRLQWKIVARNQNDDKDTWFYVDIETGELSHRFKKIYGE